MIPSKVEMAGKEVTNIYLDVWLILDFLIDNLTSTFLRRRAAPKLHLTAVVFFPLF